MSESKIIRDLKIRIKSATAERNNAQMRIDHLTEMLESELRTESDETEKCPSCKEKVAVRTLGGLICSNCGYTSPLIDKAFRED